MTDDAGTRPSEASGRPQRGGRQAKKATAKAVKKAAVKKAAVKKAAVKKAAVKKAAVKKAAVKKAAVKKAPAKTLRPAQRATTARPTGDRTGHERVAAARKAFQARNASVATRAPGREVPRATEVPSVKPEREPPPAPPAPGPPQWGAPQWPPPWSPPAPSTRTDGLAIAALVTGIVSIPLVITILGSGVLGLAAVVLGVAALSRIRDDPGRSGRGMAVSGIVTGTVGIALTALVFVLPGGEEDYNELDVVSYRNLRTGDCYERDFGVLGVVLEDCTFGHDREVVGVVDHSAPPRAPFPGKEALEREAEDLCRPLYQSYLGPDADPTLFVQQNLQPTRGAWRDGGRRIVCSVERRDGRPLIGSVKDGGGPFNR